VEREGFVEQYCTGTSRGDLLEQLADLITTVKRPHPVRVGVDGISAAGKTTLADELIEPIERRGHPVIRASVDSFHRPRSERYRRGVDSPVGYYLDSFDYDALCTKLLIPLGPGGSRSYRTRVFDSYTDSPIDAPQHNAPENAVLLVDGVFLFRPELNFHWDFRIFVHIDFEEAIRRACERDLSLLGSVEAIRDRYYKKYFPGERMYLDSVRPAELADVIVENSVPELPLVVVCNR